MVHTDAPLPLVVAVKCASCAPHTELCDKLHKSSLGPDALALAQYNAQHRVDTSTRIVLAPHKIMRDFCACQDKVSGSTPLHTVPLFIAVALSRYAISLMRNVDPSSSFPQLRKANQGFNPITSLSSQHRTYSSSHKRYGKISSTLSSMITRYPGSSHERYSWRQF